LRRQLALSPREIETDQLNICTDMAHQRGTRLGQ